MSSLKANSRKILGRAVKQLLKKNIVPAVIYGRGFKSENIEVDKNNFKKVFTETGTNTIVDLAVDQQTPFKVLVHDLQYDQVSDELIHVDFYRIHEKEKVKVKVKIKFLGEAPVVKEQNGVLVHNLSELEIQALPKDLIHEINVDLSGLKEFSDLIRVKDLKISSNVEISNDLEDVVVSVSMPRQEEEEVKPVAEGETAAAGEGTSGEEKKEEVSPATAKTEKKEEK